MPMLCSQMWNTKLQTYKSKFVCWVERMVRGSGFWWPPFRLDYSYSFRFVVYGFSTVQICSDHCHITRESKIMFNLKCKWCCIYCMFCVDVSPPFVQEHKGIDPLSISCLYIRRDSVTSSLVVSYITLAWSATDLDLDLNLTLLIF